MLGQESRGCCRDGADTGVVLLAAAGGAGDAAAGGMHCACAGGRQVAGNDVGDTLGDWNSVLRRNGRRSVGGGQWYG